MSFVEFPALKTGWVKCMYSTKPKNLQPICEEEEGKDSKKGKISSIIFRSHLRNKKRNTIMINPKGAITMIQGKNQKNSNNIKGIH